MVIMRQTAAELFDLLTARPVMCTFKQYSITIGSVPDVAGDAVIFGTVLTQIVVHNVVKFRYSGLHSCRYIRPKVVEDGMSRPLSV